MALDKAIEHGKEKRKPYKGAKAVACSCRIKTCVILTPVYVIF